MPPNARCLSGPDPKVVQRVLGHATAAMTMDLYGHMIDANLWQAAQLVGDISGTSEPPGRSIRTNNHPGEGTKIPKSWASCVEPPIGIEPMTYALRGGLEPSSDVHQITPACSLRSSVPSRPRSSRAVVSTGVSKVAIADPWLANSAHIGRWGSLRLVTGRGRPFCGAVGH